MYLTPHEIAQGREQALNHLLGLSAACLYAGQRFTELFASAGRDTLHAGSQHLNRYSAAHTEHPEHSPASFWHEHGARHSKLFDEACTIVGDTQRVLILNAEAQLRTVDEMFLAGLERAAKNSPWESEIAFNTLRTTLQTAANTLRGMSIAAVDTVALGEEEEVHQITDRLADMPAQDRPEQKPKAPTRSRSKAN